MFDYALKLYTGKDVDLNKKEAAKYYKMAADLGQSEAIHNYAMMLKKGEGIKVNKKEARKYMKMTKSTKSHKPLFIDLKIL